MKLTFNCHLWGIVAITTLWKALSFSATPLSITHCFLHPSASVVDISPTERGVRVTGKGLVQDEILLSVPLEHVITPERGRETPVGRSILADADMAAICDNSTFLAFWLCHVTYERTQSNLTDANAIFYLDTLPSLVEMGNLPLFWTEQDLSELEGSHLQLDILVKRNQWESMYEEIVERAPFFGEQTSLNTFLWANSLVDSRCFRLREVYFEDKEEQKVERPTALVPLADMLNHKSRLDPTTCNWRVERDLGAFVVRVADGGLTTGSEVCQSYGLHPNSHYLSHYGFAMESNRGPDGACPDMACVEILSKLGMNSEIFSISIGNKKRAKALLSAVRMNHVQVGEALPSSCKVPVSLQTERDAMRQLQHSINVAVGRYQTSLEQDLELLEHVPIGTNQRNAILVRSGEKGVLRHWQNLCDDSLVYLDDVAKGKKSWSDYCDFLEASLGCMTPLRS